MQPVIGLSGDNRPPSGSLVLGGVQPGVAVTQDIAVTDGALALAGLQANLALNLRYQPAVGVITLGGVQPVLSISTAILSVGNPLRFIAQARPTVFTADVAIFG